MFNLKVSMILQFSGWSLNESILLLLWIWTHKSWTKFFIRRHYSMRDYFRLVKSWGYCRTKIAQSNFLLRLTIDSWWKKRLYFCILKWFLRSLQHNVSRFFCIFYINWKQPTFSMWFLSNFLRCPYQLKPTKNWIH